MRQMFLSAESVYGLVLVAGMIVVSRTLTASSIDALLTVVTTLLVFYFAHVYAGMIPHLGGRDGAPRELRTAFIESVKESSGMLFAGLAPIVLLVLGVIGVLGDDHAVWAALLVDLVLLGAVGWFVAAATVQSTWGRVGGALLTAAFGGVLIMLKAFVHH